MKPRLPIAAAFWLPPLIVPVAVGGLLSPHLFDAGGTVLGATILSLAYAYATVATLGIPAFKYFRSKSSPRPWWATMFGGVAGTLSMLVALVIIVSAQPEGPLSQEPRAIYLFTFESLALLGLGAFLGAVIAALSWHMLKAYPPLRRFL